MADSKTTFQSTKALLDTTINEIIECLESKRTELSHLIDDYESDYDIKQSETISDLNQLEQLKKHTEELAKNNLSDLQEKVVEDITLKISKLEFESKLPQLKVSCDSEGLFSLVNDISILGYESGSLECDSDDNSEVANGEVDKGAMGATGRGKKVPREKKERKEKKGKKGEHVVCDCGDDCEFTGDEPLDKKTKKLMKKLEKEEREEAKKEKKKWKEERKNSDREIVQEKKGKSKGKVISSLDVDSLIGATDMTESL